MSDVEPRVGRYPWGVGGVQLALITVVLVAAILGGYVLGVWEGAEGGVMSEEVLGIFVDVNGDGRLDLLVSGEVVFDAGPLAERTSTP